MESLQTLMSDSESDLEIPLDSLERVQANFPANTSRLRYLRYAALPLLGAAVVFLSVSAAIDSLIEADVGNPHRVATDGLIGLWRSVGTSYFRTSACDGTGVCFCTSNFKAEGKDKYGVSKIVPANSMFQACQVWKFKVGDVIFVEAPAGHQNKYFQASVVSWATGSPFVHSAIVTRIRGDVRDAENIIVTEAMKGDTKKVVQNTVKTLVERYPFGGLSIRRVDRTRFPNFFSKQSQEAITAWGDTVLNQPFDKKMVNPLTMRFSTGPRFFDYNPACSERERAVAMWRVGGPGQWMCAQLVAWTLAFAGGLDFDTAGMKEEGCTAHRWVVTNLNPNPGSLFKEGEGTEGFGSGTVKGFFERTSWSVPCDKDGCFIGAPVKVSR